RNVVEPVGIGLATVDQVGFDIGGLHLGAANEPAPRIGHASGERSRRPRRKRILDQPNAEHDDESISKTHAQYAAGTLRLYRASARSMDDWDSPSDKRIGTCVP